MTCCASSQEERRAKLSKYRYDAVSSAQTDVQKLQESIQQRLKEVCAPSVPLCTARLLSPDGFFFALCSCKRARSRLGCDEPVWGEEDLTRACSLWVWERSLSKYREWA
jgi:hypothetical protein